MRLNHSLTASDLGMDLTPFELGLAGEYWDIIQGALIVPVTTAPLPEKALMIMREHSGNFVIIGETMWEGCPDMLMTAAIVQDIIDKYKEGKLS